MRRILGRLGPSLGSIDELPGSLGDAATAARLERTPAGLRGVIQGPLAVFQRRKNAIDPVKHLLLECALPMGGVRSREVKLVDILS